MLIGERAKGSAGRLSESQSPKPKVKEIGAQSKFHTVFGSLKGIYRRQSEVNDSRSGSKDISIRQLAPSLLQFVYTERSYKHLLCIELPHNEIMKFSLYATVAMIGIALGAPIEAKDSVGEFFSLRMKQSALQELKPNQRPAKLETSAMGIRPRHDYAEPAKKSNRDYDYGEPAQNPKRDYDYAEPADK
jgi:hypothetical protein